MSEYTKGEKLHTRAGVCLVDACTVKHYKRTEKDDSNKNTLAMHFTFDTSAHDCRSGKRPKDHGRISYQDREFTCLVAIDVCLPEPESHDAVMRFA